MSFTNAIYPRNVVAREAITVSHITHSCSCCSQDEWIEMHLRVAEGLEAGWMTPVVDRTYPLEQVRTPARESYTSWVTDVGSPCHPNQT